MRKIITLPVQSINTLKGNVYKKKEPAKQRAAGSSLYIKKGVKVYITVKTLTGDKTKVTIGLHLKHVYTRLFNGSSELLYPLAQQSSAHLEKHSPPSKRGNFFLMSKV